MISFLRKIRQKLLLKNQLKKYFIYAIGEILLVVVGILIALQVNNWNIEKNNHKKAAQLAQNLSIELHQLKGLIENRIEGIDSQKKLTLYLMNSDNIEKDSILKLAKSGQLQIDALNFLFSFKFHLNPRSDVYNSAVSDGSISLLKSEKLISFLNTAYKMSMKRMTDHTLAENDINSLLNEHVASTYQHIFASEKPENIDGAWNETVTYKILKQVKNDGKLKYLLSSKLQLLKFKHGDLNYRILPVLENAIELIEKEN